MENNRTELSKLGEFALIDHLTQSNEIRRSETVLGIGDDAAVVDSDGRQTVISTDMLIEGVHFDLTYTSLKHLGYKSVAVNVSDIIAMNAEPTHITMSIAVSNRFSVEALEEFYEGVYYACDRFNIDLIGGDTTSSQKGMIVSVTAIGFASEDKIVKRSGAKKGDLICATGDLGAAYLGLQLLEREKQLFLEHKDIQPDLENRVHCIGKLLMPVPRADIKQWLYEKNIKPTAMMDISDGLSSEILHITKQSGVGSVIYEEKIPIHDEAREVAFKFNLDPTACALSGGEDYELIFTVAQNDYETLVLNEQISVIGYITDKEDGNKIITKNKNEHQLIAQGWNSF